MDELLQEFIAETRETLAAIASEIVAWEADPADRARLDAIFRFVHTVKGSCGFLDLPRLARLSHEAENVLAAARDGRRVPDARLVDAVLAIVDRIGELSLALETGVEVEASGDDALIAALAEDAPEPVTATAQIGAAAPSNVPERRLQRSVRLPVDLLDRVMNGMSDLVLARNELARKLREGSADPVAEAALERLSLTVADLRDTVARTRMQPIDALFTALPRLVRDAAGQLGKSIDLNVVGREVEIDREMIEAMRDPLMHIVRNAIDHGIEDAAARTRAGKPPAGRLTVAARQSGNTIVIEVSDDGAGIDTARLIAKHAAATGRDPRDFAHLSERARAELIFEPGLSSRDDVGTISGRGVGMDVVRANVEQVGGRVELRNAPGRGLTILIHVPLTLSIIPAIVLTAGGQRFAIARQSVEEIVAIDCASVRVSGLGGGAVADVRGRRLPVIGLGPALGLAERADAGLIAIVGVPGGTFALGIEQVEDMQELVVKPAAPPVMACGLFAGQTLPDTGVPMLVLDAAGIASAAGLTFTRDGNVEAEPAPVAEPGVEVLLVRDLDGTRRAIPLGAVERITVERAERVGFAGGRPRFCADGQVTDVIARSALPADGAIALIWTAGPVGSVALAVAEALEIVTLAADWADGSADVLGVALHDGAPIEVIDPYHLPDAATMPPRPVVPGGSRLCLLAGEAQPWMRRFLAPTLERAGYRVAIANADEPSGAPVLAMDGEDVTLPPGSRLIRLDERPGGSGVYRYDRSALLTALAKVAS